MLFYIAVLCVLFINCPHRPGAIISGDPVASYAPAIETEFVCDWHSALYLSECIYLKHILQFFGWDVSGLHVLYVTWYITALVIFALLGYWYHVLKRKFRLEIVFDVVCCVLLFANLRGVICFLSIDFAFTAIFLLSLTLLYLIKQYRYNKKMIFLFGALLLLVLYQMIELRKNAIVLIPFFFYCGILLVVPKSKNWLACICSVFISIAFYAVSQQITQKLFTDQKTYPASVMMMSDMWVAASLRGETETLKSEIVEETGYRVEYASQTPKFKACIPYFPAFPVNEYGIDNWNRLKEMYIRTWTQHADSMIDSRVLQLVQFYLNGYTPGWMVDVYEKRYNLEGKIHSTYSNRNWKIWVTLYAWIVPMLIMFLYALYLLILYVRNKIDDHRRDLFIGCLFALLYACSYIPVTPTPDVRYKLACILVSCCVSGVVCSLAYRKIKLRKKRHVGFCADSLTKP